MIRLIQVFCIALFSSTVSQASSSLSEEGSFTLQVGAAAQEFAEEHAGISPSSWADLRPYFNNKPIDELFPGVLPTKRYAFLLKPLRLTGSFEGEIILITRKPFKEIKFLSYRNSRGNFDGGLKEPGRYIIYRTSEGTFLRAWVTEDYVQQIFRGAGSALPQPDNEADRQHEIDFRRRKMAPWIALAAVVLGTLILWLINRK